jgi:hypothetical protein
MVRAVIAGDKKNAECIKTQMGRRLPPFFFELVVAGNTNSRDLPKDGSVKKISS